MLSYTGSTKAVAPPWPQSPRRERQQKGGIVTQYVSLSVGAQHRKIDLATDIPRSVRGPL